jgi:hypothetical protein
MFSTIQETINKQFNEKENVMNHQKKTTDSNVKDPSKVKTLEELRTSINKRYEDIERNFYQLGLDLLKVNLYVKNFRKWVKENTEMSTSMAYTLMRLVKRDQELSDSKKYLSIKPKVSLYKLIKLLKYPPEFIDQLDFAKVYDVPGGQKFNLLDMPRELFAEVIDHENRMLTAKERGEEDELTGVPMDEMIISKAKDKLTKMSSELENIVTVLSEVHVQESSKEKIANTIEQLESINTQAQHINEVAVKILSTLKGQPQSNAKVA